MQSTRWTLSFAILALSACVSSAPEPERVGNAVTGRQVAENFCSGCHAISTTGDSPAPAAPPFRTILDTYPADKLAADLRNAKSISYLHMPQFFFGDSHAEDLVAYLKTIN